MTQSTEELASHAQPASSSGSFAPLRQPVFAVLWAATVLGNIGSFMRDVASSWLVTDLSASPAAVALIQTAATLPIFLLAIPGGRALGHPRPAPLPDLRAALLAASAAR